MSPLLRLLAIVMALFVAAATSGCSEERDDGPSPSSDKLPKLELTDSSPGLLLTWIDERGATHTGVSMSDVPEGSKKLVRIVTESGGHGAIFYVADLTNKQGDGSYAVRNMPRKQWESIIEERRAAYRASVAPPPVPSASAAPSASAGKSNKPDAGISAIVYGAKWCKPCHQARTHLKKRGVKVTYYDIEKRPGRAAEMRGKLRDAGMRGSAIPVIDIEGSILTGFSTRALDKAIRKAGGTRL